MKKAKNIRICIDNIIIGTQYEEESLYHLNNNSQPHINILESIIETIFFIFLKIFLFLKKITNFIKNILKIFL